MSKNFQPVGAVMIYLSHESFRPQSGKDSESTHRVSGRIQRVVFAGARPLGAFALELLYRLCRDTGRKIVGVLTDPLATGKGWWSEGGQPEVSELAVSLGLECLTTEQLQVTKHDLLFSVYWHRIFKPTVLETGLLNVNMHTAPLPEYRGRFSCSMALLNNDKEFGTTLHIMEKDADCGAIIASKHFAIGNDDTARSLYDKSNALSAELLVEWLPKILNGNLVVEEQAALAARTGRPVRSYDRKALEPFLYSEPSNLSLKDADRWLRALTFPPRYEAPRWLAELLRSA
jgi:methionyl-tRNA formyltransferase